VSKVAWRWTRRTVVVVDMEDEAETPRYQLHLLALFGASGANCHRKPCIQTRRAVKPLHRRTKKRRRLMATGKPEAVNCGKS
jgi:hypothetical protein